MSKLLAKFVRSPSEERRFPFLDGYRAIAALAVVLFHVATATGAVGNESLGLTDPAAWIGRLGNWGVTIFFLISGFLLYRPYVIAHLTDRKPMPWHRFLRRRAVRIFPAYWLVLGTVLATGATGQMPQGSTPDWITYPAVVLLMQNYIPGLALVILPVAWTLSIELGFYLMLPTIAAAIRRIPGGRAASSSLRLRAQVLGVIAVYLFAWGYRLVVVAGDFTNEATLLTWPFNYLDWFALGMALAVAQAWREQGGRLPSIVTSFARLPWLCWLVALQIYWVGVALNIPTGFGTPAESGQTLGRFLVNGLAAFFLILPGTIGTARRSRGLALLRTWPLVFLGTISYGIYLWHTPIIKKIKQFDANPEFWPLLFVVVVFAIALAWPTDRLIERPLQRFRYSRRERQARRRPPDSAGDPPPTSITPPEPPSDSSTSDESPRTSHRDQPGSLAAPWDP